MRAQEMARHQESLSKLEGEMATANSDKIQVEEEVKRCKEKEADNRLVCIANKACNNKFNEMCHLE